MIKIAPLHAIDVKIFLCILMSAAKLNALLIHVPNVFWREVRVGGIQVLEKLKVTANICWVEVLSTLRIKIQGLGEAQLIVASLKAVASVKKNLSYSYLFPSYPQNKRNKM